MKVLFWLYKSRINAVGNAPLMMRISHEGSRVSFSTNIFIPIHNWDSIRQRIKGSVELAKQYNQVLNSLRSKAWQKYAESLTKGEPVDPRKLKNVITGEDRPAMTLVQAVNEHIEFLKTRAGLDVSLNTIKKYQTLARKINGFLQTMKASDIRLHYLKRQFIIDFDSYMRKVEKLSHNGVAKNMQQLKRVIKVCVQKEWLDKDPFAGYTCTIKSCDRGYLSSKELFIMNQHHFDSDRLQRVADIFIFCCYTGLSYADVSKVTVSDLEEDAHGITWIRIHRTKTGNMSLIPLLQIPYKLLHKYKVSRDKATHLLPIISNQNLNKYLKEIATILGITKRLSMHLARHTFATTVTLEKGIDITTVSRMLGHRDIRTTQIYSKVTKLKIAIDMQKLLDTQKAVND